MSKTRAYQLNRWKTSGKKYHLHCMWACLTSHRVMFDEAECVHVIKLLTVPKLLWYRCLNGISVFTVCFATQHQILWILSRCISWEQWVLWHIALLMNRDESMLRDLDRKGEDAIIERAAVAFQLLSQLSVFMCRILPQHNNAEQSPVREVTANPWRFDLFNGVAEQLIFAALHTTAVWVHTAAEPVNSEVKVQEIHEHKEVKAS